MCKKCHRGTGRGRGTCTRVIGQMKLYQKDMAGIARWARWLHCTGWQGIRTATQKSIQQMRFYQRDNSCTCFLSCTCWQGTCIDSNMMIRRMRLNQRDTYCTIDSQRRGTCRQGIRKNKYFLIQQVRLHPWDTPCTSRYSLGQIGTGPSDSP
jgi:hypothetical protein